jgi:hypothetical protein
MPRNRVPLGTLGTDQAQFNGNAALQRLHNLAMREPGMVEPLPGRAQVALNIAPANYDVRRMWPIKDGGDTLEIALVRSTSGPTYGLRSIESASSNEPTVAHASLIGEPCGLTEARQRQFYAGPLGVLVLEEDASETRMLGMMPPTWIGISGETTTDAQAVPATSRVAWRATLHRKHSDDYEITSAPSYAMYAESAGSITDFTVRIGWPDSASFSDDRVREGDIVKLWRARSVTAGTSTNDRHLLTAERVLVAADIAARYVEIRDVTPDAALASGEELYTNPGAQGALQANGQLGKCADAAVYNGHAFYAQTSLPTYLKLRVPSGIGYLSTNALRTYGVGVRQETSSATTLGSPTITGVNTLGMVAGQVIVQASGTPPFAVGAVILSVNHGASTITMTSNAASTDAAFLFQVADTVEINGSLLRMANLKTMLADAWTANLRAIITPSIVVDGEATIGSGTGDDGVEIIISLIAPEGTSKNSLFFEATNGDNYSPRVPVAGLEGTIDERKNRAAWAKLGQPEHVPAANELPVGKGEIVRFLSTQDRLLAFCTDGAYAITGLGPNWNVDQVDKDLVIASQAAADEMNGAAYVYAKDRGLLRIERSGAIAGLTKGAVQQAMNAEIRSADGGSGYEAHVVCDALHDEAGVFFQSPPGSA